MKYITRTVWILSIVSLLTDTASEMLYPIMPIYLKSIGFSIILIGILEGVAEATAGLSKGYFGNMSDQMGRRVPFVRIGYVLSAISKPMMALFVYPLWIFFSRTIDRFGKGIRTGARDAILSDEATPETKAKVFGFHRSMDTFGAVLGPVGALVFLYFYPAQYKTLFFIAFIPGILATLMTFYLKEKKISQQPVKKTNSFFSFIKYWKDSPTLYRKVVVGLLVFALFNSSDAFLLLKGKDAGLNDVQVVGVYIFYNLIYSLFAFPIGILADKVGLKKIFIFGLLIFAVVYFGMSATFSLNGYLVLFLAYGIYAAATEGVSKAWISNIVDKKELGTAIGTYSGFQSICSMIASAMTGVIWFNFGSNVAFLVTGIAALLVVIYFIFIEKINSNLSNNPSL